jgi:hypothetical protein
LIFLRVPVVFLKHHIDFHRIPLLSMRFLVDFMRVTVDLLILKCLIDLQRIPIVFHQVPACFHASYF